MLLALLLLASSLALGLAAAARVTEKNQLAYALPIALAAGAWIVNLATLALGFNETALYAAVAAQTILAAVLYRKTIFKHDKAVLCLLAVGLLAFAGLENARMHYDAAGNLAGVPIDLGFHTAIITTLANGNQPPVNPFYDGHPLNYYYFTHSYSAALLVGGLNLETAAALPPVLAGAAFLALVYEFCRKRFPKRAPASLAGFAVLACILILFNGTMAFENLNYPFFHNQLRDSGFPFENILIDFFIINFSAVLALTLAIIILKLILEKKTEAVWLTSLLPMINLPTFLILLIPNLLEKINIKKIMLPIGLAIVQVAVLLIQNAENFTPHLRLGWLSTEQNFASIAAFWLNNLGPYLVLSFIGLYWLKNKDANRMWLALLPPVILANIFIFTPYAWDNFKFFLIFFIYTAILSAYAITEMWRRGAPWRILAGALFVVMTLTGFLSVATLLENSNTAIYTAADLRACEWIQENTPKDAVFLIDNEMHSCLPGIAGRRVYLGFGEWLTNHGIDYSQQLVENERMLAGDCVLIKEKNVRYAYFTANVKPTEELEAESTRIYEDNSHVILQICVTE
ncbi:MAG: DUF2298 domain-containing protein [Candidatus Micrarchaeia archaeon]